MMPYLCLFLFAVCTSAQAGHAVLKNKQDSGVLFGAYMDFGETEDEVTLEGIEAFEKLAQKKPAIIASSS